MPDVVENGTELVGIHKENLENNKQTQNAALTLKLTWINKIVNFFAYLTVEPFLLFYMLPNSVSIIAVTRLNTEKACRSDLNYSEAVCLLVRDGYGGDNITGAAQNATQKMLAEMAAWKTPVESSVPLIVVLFVGAWSDRTGNRKLLMLVPLIGQIITAFGLILATYFFLQWPLWATALIEALPSALTGGSTIAFMGAFSYMADVTTLESRTFRMGFIAIITSVVPTLGQAISGVLLAAVGYYGVFSITTILFLIGFIQTYFKLHNIRNDKVEGTLLDKVIDLVHPRNAWDSISILFVTPWKERIQAVLVICAHITFLGPIVGVGDLVFYYLQKKFGMNVVELSYFVTFASIVAIVGAMASIMLFNKLLKLHDAVMAMIATISVAMSNIVAGLAPTRIWYYSGPVFGFFGGIGPIATKSLGTKVVDPDNVGKFLSLMSVGESLTSIIYTPIFAKLYANTVTTVISAIFYLGAVLTVIPFILLCIIYFIDKRVQRDVVKNPELKEMHAHDNQISSL